MGTKKGYMNFNTGLYTTLTTDDEGKIIESVQRDSVFNVLKTVYFDWEENTCYQSVYGPNNHLQYSDTIVCGRMG